VSVSRYSYRFGSARGDLYIAYHGGEGVAQAPLRVCPVGVDVQGLLELNDGLCVAVGNWLDVIRMLSNFQSLPGKLQLHPPV